MDSELCDMPLGTFSEGVPGQGSAWRERERERERERVREREGGKGGGRGKGESWVFYMT